MDDGCVPALFGRSLGDVCAFVCVPVCAADEKKRNSGKNASAVCIACVETRYIFLATAAGAEGDGDAYSRRLAARCCRLCVGWCGDSTLFLARLFLNNNYYYCTSKFVVVWPRTNAAPRPRGIPPFPWISPSTPAYASLQSLRMSRRRPLCVAGRRHRWSRSLRRGGGWGRVEPGPKFVLRGFSVYDGRRGRRGFRGERCVARLCLVVAPLEARFTSQGTLVLSRSLDDFEAHSGMWSRTPPSRDQQRRAKSRPVAHYCVSMVDGRDLAAAKASGGVARSSNKRLWISSCAYEPTA